VASFPFEIDGAQIVMLGNFNPGIFQPKWFASHALIRDEEADHAQGLVFSPQVAAFTTGWLKVQVTAERFEVISEDSMHTQPLRDLVVSVFELLEHTPVTTMGLNRWAHIKMSSEEEWHKVGHCLAPKRIWNELLERPGLRSLMIEGTRTTAKGAKVFVRVEPSVKVSPGVFVMATEEYASATKDVSGLLATLRTSWEDLSIYLKRVVEHVLTEASAWQPSAK
jgi:hypothetical protein